MTLSKGFRGLGVKTDGRGIIIAIDPSSAVAQSGDLSLGDQITLFENFDMPAGRSLEEVTSEPQHRNKGSYSIGVVKGVVPRLREHTGL